MADSTILAKPLALHWQQPGPRLFAAIKGLLFLICLLPLVQLLWHALLGHAHKGAGQVGQVGPGVRHVQRARVGPSALGQRRGAGDDLGQSRTFVALFDEKLPRGRDDRLAASIQSQVVGQWRHGETALGGAEEIDNGVMIITPSQLQ